jgi:DNA-binding NarL/FixJ family response regulator
MPARHDAPIRVFLIDDHRMVLWGLERLVESASPEMTVVGSATDCATAFKLLDTACPDVILLDLVLGNNESGLDAIPLLLARSKAKILAVTGAPDSAVHDRAAVAGARGVIGKEASAEMLLKAIRKVHAGELWLANEALGRIFVEFSRKVASPKGTDDPEARKISLLTDRERQIIVGVASDPGVTVRKLAHTLHISEHTVHNHLTSIYGKLGVASRVGLFAYAREHGFAKKSP